MLAGLSKLSQPLSQTQKLPRLSQASSSPSQILSNCPSNCINPVKIPVKISKYTKESLLEKRLVDLHNIASTFSLTKSGNKSTIVSRILTHGTSDVKNYDEQDVNTYPRNHLLILADELLVSRKPIESLQIARH